MKKSILAIGMAITVFLASGFTTYADTSATVSFTSDKKLVYSGVTVENGQVNLGSAFENVAPGETRTQTIVVKNENKHTADFYMSTEIIKALEDGSDTAKGAGYEIVLKAGDNTLYDSTLGGYAANEAASKTGIGSMNAELGDNVLIATLKKGESTDVVLQIAFDGEAMDNTAENDYSLTSGQLAFDFLVSYDDAEAPVSNKKTGSNTTPTSNTKPGVNHTVTIVDEGVPLSAVKTGDESMIGVTVAVLVAGVVLLMLGRKKKEEN